MKSLSLRAPHLIVMVGVPGAGKSFFADHFSETFNAPIISWDKLRQTLFNEPAYTKDEDEVIERTALLMLEQFLKTKTTIIFDGQSGSQVSRQNLTRIAKKAGFETLFIWAQTDLVTAKRRSQKKSIPLDIFDSQVKRFTALKPTDHAVVISGKHTYATQLKTVLRRLSESRVQATEQTKSRTLASRPRLIR